jgi:4'-phosphopantetheinyl transferase EntD
LNKFINLSDIEKKLPFTVGISLVNRKTETSFALSVAEKNIKLTYNHKVARIAFQNGRLALKLAYRKFCQKTNLNCNKILSIEKSCNGAPLLPIPFCGSISHSDYFAGAILTSQENTAAIGIDLERVRVINSPQDILKKITTLNEIIVPDSEVQIFFSNKESAFKIASQLEPTIPRSLKVCCTTNWIRKGGLIYSNFNFNNIKVNGISGYLDKSTIVSISYVVS